MKDRLLSVLQLDVLRVTPSAAIEILRFRTTRTRPRTTSADTPQAVQAVVVGDAAELCVKGVFPRTTCRVVADLDAVVIRWSQTHFISINTVQSVQSAHQQSSRLSSRGSLRSANQQSSRLSRRGSVTPRFGNSRTTTLASSVVRIIYSDRGGVLRVLELSCSEEKGSSWSEGLQTLLDAVPRQGVPAHWRWALSCMAATSRRGATGFLRQGELATLLTCANSIGVSAAALETALQSVNSAQQQEAPPWLRTRADENQRMQLLGPQSIVGVLLRLCMSSQHISELYRRYTDRSGLINSDRWLEFQRCEQLAPHSEQGELRNSQDDEMEIARESFRQAFAGGKELPPEAGLGIVQFALQLLSPNNDAVANAQGADEMSKWEQPFAHYWTAASHNSYIVGDQLTVCGVRLSPTEASSSACR